MLITAISLPACLALILPAWGSTAAQAPCSLFASIGQAFQSSSDPRDHVDEMRSRGIPVRHGMDETGAPWILALATIPSSEENSYDKARSYASAQIAKLLSAEVSTWTESSYGEASMMAPDGEELLEISSYFRNKVIVQADQTIRGMKLEGVYPGIDSGDVREFVFLVSEAGIAQAEKLSESFTASEALPEEGLWVEATGFASVGKSGEEAAEIKALDMAKRSALEQVFGAIVLGRVTTETVDELEEFKSTVFTQTDGYVKKYKDINTDSVGGGLLLSGTFLVQATEMFDGSLEVFVRAMGYPSLRLQVKGDDSDTIESVSKEVESALIALGVRTKGSRSGDVDYIIRVVASKQPLPDPRRPLAPGTEVALSASLYSVTFDETLPEFYPDATGSSFISDQARQTQVALKSTAKDLATQIQKGLRAWTLKQVREGRQVRIRIHDLPDPALNAEIKNAVSALPSVREVHLLQETALLDLRIFLLGSTHDLDKGVSALLADLDVETMELTQTTDTNLIYRPQANLSDIARALINRIQETTDRGDLLLAMLELESSPRTRIDKSTLDLIGKTETSKSMKRLFPESRVDFQVLRHLRELDQFRNHRSADVESYATKALRNGAFFDASNEIADAKSALSTNRLEETLTILLDLCVNKPLSQDSQGKVRSRLRTGLAALKHVCEQARSLEEVERAWATVERLDTLPSCVGFDLASLVTTLNARLEKERANAGFIEKFWGLIQAGDDLLASDPMEAKRKFLQARKVLSDDMGLDKDHPLHLIPRCREGECYYETARRLNRTIKKGRVATKTAARLGGYKDALKRFEDVLAAETDSRDKDDVSMKAHAMYRTAYMYLQMAKYHKGVYDAHKSSRNSTYRKLAQKHYDLLVEVQPKATQAEKALKKDYSSERDKDGNLYAKRSLG